MRVLRRSVIIVCVHCLSIRFLLLARARMRRAREEEEQQEAGEERGEEKEDVGLMGNRWQLERTLYNEVAVVHCLFRGTCLCYLRSHTRGGREGKQAMRG